MLCLSRRAMELPWLGEHCSERSCKQLDFLPLKCDACGEVFCKDHIRYDDHKCSSAYKKIFTNKCVKPGCKRKEMMKLVCEQCGGSFCIKHRHPLDHDCKGSSQPISKAGYAALMRAAHSTFKSPGATGVPSNGNRQHNRYQLHGEKRQTKTGLVSTRCSSATVTPLTALELVADL
ncbi:PREDICTED: AN1-type zinc finger protein 2A isoform X3 [Ficedula albicollis]|uniref:AN1-type zinc finger protein 2A isoform X3 n=1 Tax=Ficedula albicollis TaxID=59894 RepID=UPI0003599C13|nr:PREDICTED: AN1-type zinc finger protein 2A isoform X3 [Ficedula albicollis]